MWLFLIGIIVRDSTIINTASISNEHYRGVNCIFSHCTSSYFGGAVYFNGLNFNISFECCGFYYCTSQSQGGAIFIDQARLSKFVRCNMQNCSASSSSSYRIGMGARSVLYDEMTDLSESYSYTNGHGSLHGCSHLTYKNNNHTYSRSASTTYGESIFSCLNEYSFSFSNFAHDNTANYLSPWVDMSEFKYLNDNFINITCAEFIHCVRSTTLAEFYQCSFMGVSYTTLSSLPIVKIANSYFDVENMNTSQCIVFSNNQMNTQHININDCRPICYHTGSYPSFRVGRFLRSYLILLSNA